MTVNIFCIPTNTLAHGNPTQTMLVLTVVSMYYMAKMIDLLRIPAKSN